MNKFKSFQQVRICNPQNKWHGMIATVSGYCGDGSPYLDLGKWGPKNRNGKPVVQVVQDWMLVDDKLYPYISGKKELPSPKWPDRQHICAALINEKQWLTARIEVLTTQFRRPSTDAEVAALSARLATIDALLKG
jgi:hypothetical protein